MNIKFSDLNLMSRPQFQQAVQLTFLYFAASSDSELKLYKVLTLMRLHVLCIHSVTAVSIKGRCLKCIFLDTASARAFNLCLMMSNSIELHLFTAVLVALTHFEVMEGSGGVAESCISPF